MGIFSGIEILFFFLGVFTTLGIFGIVFLKQKHQADTPALILFGFSLALGIFTMAWSVSSVLEQEHQAANMGLLFFGLPAVLLAGIAFKRVSAARQG